MPKPLPWPPLMPTDVCEDEDDEEEEEEEVAGTPESSVVASTCFLPPLPLLLPVGVEKPSFVAEVPVVEEAGLPPVLLRQAYLRMRMAATTKTKKPPTAPAMAGTWDVTVAARCGPMLPYPGTLTLAEVRVAASALLPDINALVRR